MATKAATKRLGKEAQMMDKDPPPYCYGRPREDNVLEWHFILRGPPDTPFHGGEYWGQLLFPPEYPFKPPGIKMSTPSGRFHTDSKICTSMSDFHPGSWNPAWSVANILVGLLSFMSSDEMTTGSVMATHADRCLLAQRSHAFNITQPRFKRLFPDYCTATIRDLPNMGDRKPQTTEGSSSTTSEVGTTKAGGSSTPATAAKETPSQSVRRTSAASGPSTGSSAAQSQIQPRRSAGGASQQQQQQAQAQQQADPGAQVQPRSRAIFPILVALAAYLFISRLTSLMGGSAGSSAASSLAS